MTTLLLPLTLVALFSIFPPAISTSTSTTTTLAIFRQLEAHPLDATIAEAADDNGLDPFVLKGLLWNESRLDPTMRSRGGVGIASFTPAGVRGVNEIRRRRAAESGHGAADAGEPGDYPEDHPNDTAAPFTMRAARDPELAIPAAAELLAYYVRLYGVAGGISGYNGGHLHGRAVRRWGYRGAQRRGKLDWCGDIRMSGKYAQNVLGKANQLRAEAGLPGIRIR